METLSTKLLSHYNEARPLIIESMNALVEKNYNKIMKIWKNTKNPVPLKKARKITIGGMDYYYIISLYVGESKGLEWDVLTYTFIDSEEESDLKKYNKDLIFFTTPGFTLPFQDLNGTIRYTSRFLEMYSYTYGKEDWDIYEISERWIRRNSRPLFVVTSDPIEESNDKGCNVLGKDYEGDGICIGRLGQEDPSIIKFVAYYPEEVLEDMNEHEDDSDYYISKLLENFRDYVKNVSYKNGQDKVRWPDKFMLNKYYEYED